ncbi:MAG: hypothetical protein WCW02_01890 [Candidatus Buchananbacteria bacterium]
MTNSGELSIWRFGLLAAITFIFVRVVVDTFIFPISWNWLGLLAGSIIFAIVFVMVLKYRENKKKLLRELPPKSPLS